MDEVIQKCQSFFKLGLVFYRPMIHVAAAVIRDGDQILLARRPGHLHQGGLWEFPGGKSETGEGREQALIRELQEELDITPTAYRPMIRIPHHYPDKSVLLDVWEVTEWQGKAHGREGQEICWVREDDLSQYEFPQANIPIVMACQLPSEYLITPAVEGNQEGFIDQLKKSLANGIQLVQLRQKALSIDAFRELSIKVIGVCHRRDAKVLLNADARMVEALNADGLQLNSESLMSLSERPLGRDYLISASCHNEAEIEKACQLGLDFAVLSPVQATASHPDATPLGWDQFNKLTEQSTIPVYALGGITRDDTEKSWQLGGQGVSAIRALWG